MFQSGKFLIYLLFFIVFSANIEARAQNKSLQPGDSAVDFTALNQNGKSWRLSDHLGKSELIIYFYPAAMTPGCTKQACGFRDSKKKFDSLGVQIIGISGDPVENLSQFKEAYQLNFDLLSDSDGEIAKSFGVPVKNGGTYDKIINKKHYKLSRPLTTARWTFVLDKKGKIIYKNSKVNAAQDSQIILNLLTGKKER